MPETNKDVAVRSAINSVLEAREALQRAGSLLDNESRATNYSEALERAGGLTDQLLKLLEAWTENPEEAPTPSGIE